MKQILVGLDGSPRAPGVLNMALVMARALGAKVTLFRSVGLPPDVPHDFWKTSDEPLLEQLERRAQTYLDECAAGVPSDFLAGCQVIVGAPWQAICDAARHLHAELVVIGSHGYTGLDRLLGTTAAKVVNHAPCTVVVVREPSPADPAH
jgi:nucleotide-binding universal stress UspA family protein